GSYGRGLPKGMARWGETVYRSPRLRGTPRMERQTHPVEWTDDAIVLSTRPHGESSLLVQLLTRERGRHAGLAKGAQRGQARAVFQPGTRVKANWKARLEDQLGQLTCELTRGDVALFIEDADRLAALSAAAALAEATLSEREAMP